MSTSPFMFRLGRRYLRDAPNYPLPVDLGEIHRQNLRTLLLMQVFGGDPFCAALEVPPTRVLEIACGSALWSSACHEYFKNKGHGDISFTGLDIAPLAPDLKKQGVNWQFVQHDLRKPLPFKDGEFDFIFINDGMAVFAANSEVPVSPLTGFKKYLKPGGVVEIWETDFHIRCLLPEPIHAPGMTTEDLKTAKMTATYTMSQTTPFTKAPNKFLQAYNNWLEAGFQKLGLSVAPCATLGYSLSTEAEVPENVGSKRIAIPFSPTRWEIDDPSSDCEHSNQPTKVKGKGPAAQPCVRKMNRKPLTPEQAAVRRTALNITIGLIESLEPLLKEQSGMKQDEWYRWWSNMTTDLLEKDGTANGECLEAGAWWVRKELTAET